MKLASFLLLSAVLPVATLASLLPAYGAAAQSIVLAQADDPVAAAEKALNAAEKALSNAEETGGDIRAARRSVANAMKSLRAAETAAGKTPAEPAAPAPAAAQPPATEPAAPATTTPAPTADAPKPYQPPKIEQPAPPIPAAEPKPAAQPKPAAPAKPVAPVPAPAAAPPARPAQTAKPSRPAPEGPVIVRRGNLTETRQRYPGGVTVIDLTDRNSRLVRRVQIGPDGTETVVIDRMRPGGYDEDRADSPRIYDPREVPPPPGIGGRGGLDGGRASEAEIEGALRGRPAAPGMGGYSINEIRRSERLRARVQAVDLDTITFESGSARVPDEEVWKLERIATALGRVLDRWPNQVFLIEGHTDAIGTRLANQELSDRRAASVAGILTRYFGIPARSLVTQGYGEDYLKVPTDGPSRQNRRVTIRNITPLLGR
ncbi:OmpA family protein [Mesorhizobium sp. BR1-1-16]|uniref:OmpA family protein n=1 Tax=Mesorhizobium sp. BR1-1-16 TaxID=2876653 RepID=UPI001CCB7441|nr:OmpA family protein [Mesorhizobium sp. BR1-1-16]MBZ9938187.1 OmpA family protein [Mesorhizobium sp. BR1-1-16]